MERLSVSIGDFFAESGESGWHRPEHEARRRAALAALFASLPSRRMEEGERALQLETYAGQLDDLPPEALEAAIRKLLRGPDSPWLPSIGQLRHAAAREIRALRYRVTGASTSNDYDPERGVVFDPDAEIRWARRNAAALIAGMPFPQLRSGAHRGQLDIERRYPTALPMLTEGD